jgi:serine/threonine protein kinase
MAAANACFDRDCLASWALGRLPRERFNQVDAHLEECATCRDVAASLDRLSDSLVLLLRGPMPVAVASISQAEPCSTLDHDPAADTRSGDERAVPPLLSGLPELEVRELTGKGGMGKVYKAWHVRLRCFRAVKVLFAGPRQRFEREMQALAQLDHPNIVRIHHAGETVDGQLYLVMDFLEGESLDQAVKRRGPLPVAETCELIRQAALGLHHAHERGQVHRDVKPGNLFQTVAGVVKVLDLGLVRVEQGADGESSLTHTGGFMGTAGFVAPEQVRDTRSAGIPADLFSLGCTFYFLLTGEVPFPGNTVTERLEALERNSPKPLAALRPDCPKEIVNMVATMMHKSPTKRFASMALVEAEVRRHCSQDRPRPPKSAEPRPRRLAWVAAAAALLGVMGLLGVAGVLGVMALSGMMATPTDTSQVAQGDGKPKEQKDKQPGDDDGKVKELANIGGFVQTGSSVRFFPTELKALTSEWGGPLRTWDLEKRKLLNSSGPSTIYTEFCPDGRILASTGGAQIVFYDLQTWKSVSTLNTIHSSLDYSFSADGKWFLTAGAGDGFVRLWAYPPQPEQKHHREFKHGASCTTACFTVDGKYILTGGPDKYVRLWDIANDRQEKTYKPHNSGLQLIRALPGGKRFVTVSTDWTVIVRELESGETVHSLKLEKVATGALYKVTALAIAPTGPRLLVGHQDGWISYWNLEKGVKEGAWSAHEGAVPAVDITPDGRYALSAGADKTLRYWRLPAVAGVGQRDLPVPVEKKK